MAEMTAFCVSCKKKVEMKDPKIVTLPDKRQAYKGICSKCGTTVMRMKAKDEGINNK